MENIFVINTDSDSFTEISGRNDLKAWFNGNLAFSGGPIRHGEALGRIAPGDTCLMYENGVGVVGVGRATAGWNGLAYNPPVYYVGKAGCPWEGIIFTEQDPPRDEYRLPVRWTSCEKKPISIDELRRLTGYKTPWAPRGTVCTLKNPTGELRRRVERILLQ